MKFFLLIIVFFSSCFFANSQHSANFETQPVIEQELKDEMAIRGEQELISINIIMKSQYDQFEMRRKSNFYKTKENKRSFVINELKQFSTETQKGVIYELKSLERNLKIANITSHWIYNGINCSATAEAIETLSSNPDILIIGFNREQYLLPKDEKAKDAENTKELTYNITKVNANAVWALGFTGQDVIIAVIDTGVNYNHLDIKDHLWDDPAFPYHGYDFVNNDNNPMDDHGHGSHCAGTVCGDGTAGSQTGIAPDATLMCIKVLNSEGNGSINAICSGVEFAVEQGAHIFSMSLGFANGGSTSERIQFRNTMINTLEAGVVGAVAAGNEGDQLYGFPVPNNIRVPGNCPPPWLHPDQTITGGLTCVVCVGSTTSSDNASSFTGRGPATWQSITGFNDYAYNPGIGLIRPDVCAPGSDIKSLNYLSTTGYTVMSGTSMATPCVAGVMGLMMSKNLELTPAEIDEILETTAVKLSTSKSNTFGSGRVNALDALNAVAVGPVVFHSYIINDANENNDGKLNPGETISLTVSLENVSEYSANEVAAIMSSNSPYVTIGTNVAIYGHFNIGEVKTIENAFTLTLSHDAPAAQPINLLFEVSTAIESSTTRCNIMVYDYILEKGSIVIADNNNGILEPGETADFHLFINNIGNEFASSLTGLLSTNFSGLTINTNNKSFGSLYENQSGYAIYNVTLDSTVQPEDVNIPFTLMVSDYNERQTPLLYNYQNRCNVVFDLFDTYGDGWNGASINISFDDGTPSRNITIGANQSQATYTISIRQGTTVTLSWTAGGWDSECSFEIYYEEGSAIYNASSAPSSGTFYSWNNNCSAGISPTTLCQHVDNLSASINGTDIILSWDATNAVKYNVFKNNELIANNITTTSYCVSDLEYGDYCFTVTAICDNGTETNPSNEACILFSCEAPSRLIAVNVTNEPKILLEWNAVESAQQYKIYHDDIEVASSIDTFYVITNIDLNKEHCFKVRSICFNGESDFSNTACLIIDSFNEMSPSFKVFPNPANNELHIKGENIERIKMYDVLGRVIHEINTLPQHNMIINTTSFKTGMYILEIVATDGVFFSQKVVVSH